MINLARKFLLLSGSERGLLIKAVLLLAAIKLGLWLLPFETLLRFLVGISGSPIDAPSGTSEARTFASEVVWAIETASEYTPGSKTCLVRALAAQVLLARWGYPALLHIGVLKGEGGQLQAHAWLESEGEVLIGGEEAGSFTPLTTLDEKGL